MSPDYQGVTQFDRAGGAGLPVAIIGAGPVGLSAAAHLLSRGLEPIILEAGDLPGASVAGWAHVRMFSPWRLNIDDACVSLLRGTDWRPPQLDKCPTGRELLDAYLKPLAALPVLAARIRLETKVVAVTRAGLGKARAVARASSPFEVHSIDKKGRPQRSYVRAVVDASGTWTQPNPLGASGVPTPGESGAAERIAYGMPDILGADRDRYLGKRILVAGSGYSALGDLLGCSALIEQDRRTKVYWALRKSDNPLLGRTSDFLPERGALGARLKPLIEAGRFEMLAPFAIDAVERDGAGAVIVHAATATQRQSVVVDRIVAATGFRPDHTILRELWLDLDPVFECPRRLAELIDPATHTCGNVRLHGAVELAQPEPGLFVIGMKSYGRTPTFLLATGYGQARSVAAWLAGHAEGVQQTSPATCGGAPTGRRQQC
jgi:hypothetical protein